jgi:hypothetical protein
MAEPEGQVPEAAKEEIQHLEAQPGLFVADVLAASAPPAKNKGGRPKAEMWKYYSESGDARSKSSRKYAECRYCGAKMEGRVELLERHVTTVCLHVSPEMREQALALAAKRAADNAAGAAVKKVKKKQKLRWGDYASKRVLGPIVGCAPALSRGLWASESSSFCPLSSPSKR